MFSFMVKMKWAILNTVYKIKGIFYSVFGFMIGLVLGIAWTIKYRKVLCAYVDEYETAAEFGSKWGEFIGNKADEWIEKHLYS